jgi:hypothetical protein
VNAARTAGADEEDMAEFVEYAHEHINATENHQAAHNWDFNWTLPGMMRTWLHQADASVFDRRMVSAALVGASSYHNYVGLCLDAYKTSDPRLCANFFSFLKPLSAFDRFE